ATLARHPWPGNVRELAHVVERAVLGAESAEIASSDMPAGALGSAESLLQSAVETRWTLKELTDAYIAETLRRAGGNRSLAAKRLGVSRKFLWEREKKQASGRGGESPLVTDFAGTPDEIGYHRGSQN